MFLKIIGYIPLLQCLAYFPVKAHKSASKKFITLLILTSLPIIFATVLSPIPTGESGVLEKLLNKLSDAISISELFVYTASFLTPVLYLIYERYSDSTKNELGERLADSFKGVFKGYGLVALLALLTMLFTAVAFSLIKTNTEIFKFTFLHQFLVSYAPLIYLFSLYCWYLTLLEGTSSSGNFIRTNRNAENKTAESFSARLKNRGISE